MWPIRWFRSGRLMERSLGSTRFGGGLGCFGCATALPNGPSKTKIAIPSAVRMGSLMATRWRNVLRRLRFQVASDVRSLSSAVGPWLP